MVENNDNDHLIKPGTYFTMGNFACVEAAILAGCRFYGGYPITPSSEIFERASTRFPQVGGCAVEMEDEISSMASLIGASYAGKKAMTATSGPGFSLMMENIGLAFMMEAPCVVINVQRAGPSTGIPTLIGQGDMMQARWGSHGDLESITYCPNSVQEFFELTIEAFNSAERFRMPVFVLADQVVGMMSEKLVVPPYDQIHIADRSTATEKDSISRAQSPFDFSKDFMPMPIVGTNCRLNVDSLTHDARGYPSIDHSVSEKLLSHLLGKVRHHVHEIWKWQEYELEDAETVVVSYGATSRSSLAAVKAARKRGIKAGLLRLVTVWPFPDEIIEKFSRKANVMVVPEINYGQIIHPVRENSHCPVVGVNWAPGSLMEPRAIIDALEVVVAK